jgi:hypothetical protein
MTLLLNLTHTTAYRRALELSEQGPAKRYFQRQLDRLPAS